jgi:hypothetical protein
MITATIVGALLAAIVLLALGVYIGRDQYGYYRGRADGYKAGIRHGEKARNALQARADTLNAALDEMGEMYDAGVARRFAPPIARAVAEVYDHEEAGL